MLNTGEMAADVGSVVYGEEAVELGLMDQIGSLNDALECLYGQIEKNRRDRKED
jgi:ClpP class serine protease